MPAASIVSTSFKSTTTLRAFCPAAEHKIAVSPPRTIRPRHSRINKTPHRIIELIRLIYEGHMSTLRQDHQLRSCDLLLHLPRHLWIALIVVSHDNQRWHLDLRKLIEILDFHQVAVHYKFTVRSPHFAV